jgi:hypothetical protein
VGRRDSWLTVERTVVAVEVRAVVVIDVSGDDELLVVTEPVVADTVVAAAPLPQALSSASPPTARLPRMRVRREKRNLRAPCEQLRLTML